MTKPRDSLVRAMETVAEAATGGVADTKPEAEVTGPTEHRVSLPSKWPTLNLLSRYCY